MQHGSVRASNEISTEVITNFITISLRYENVIKCHFQITMHENMQLPYRYSIIRLMKCHYYFITDSLLNVC